ncbi:MAG: response regulator [Planctomycetota bacterium]
MVIGSVLIVDSDRATVRDLFSILSLLPLQVSLAFSKADALEALLRNRIDLLIVAHGLSDGNGLELFRDSICRRSASTAVLLSRHADLSVVISAVDAGFSFVISTPVDLGQVRPVLQSIFPALTSCRQLQDMSERSCSMAVELPDLRYISNLTMAQIRSGLADSDLIRIIRSVDYPFAGKERLEYFDRDTLERVVCLVRRWSQQRIAARQEPTHSALDDGPVIPDSILQRSDSIRVSA